MHYGNKTRHQADVKEGIVTFLGQCPHRAASLTDIINGANLPKGRVTLALRRDPDRFSQVTSGGTNYWQLKSA